MTRDQTVVECRGRSQVPGALLDRGQVRQVVVLEVGIALEEAEE